EGDTSDNASPCRNHIFVLFSKWLRQNSLEGDRVAALLCRALFVRVKGHTGLRCAPFGIPKSERFHVVATMGTGAHFHRGKGARRRALPLSRHSRESGNPVDSNCNWVPAFAGMTNKVRAAK